MATEGLTLSFTPDAVDAIADMAVSVNREVENIGARRLHTMLEKLMEEISFTATDRSEKQVTIDADYVQKELGELAEDHDLSKFIL
jgi:ATP-dependent HslUV protease ATP-binding subunit HslU